MSPRVNMPMRVESEAPAISSVHADLGTAADTCKPQRDSALDFTKGALVLLMVLYHWVNYFIGPQWGYYRYLRFLTSSFIFITGFLISRNYLARYSTADRWKRLVRRGLKLLILFVLLNVARIVILPVLGTAVVEQKLVEPSTIYTLFVSGNFPIVGGKLASFSILVPISYLLMLSAGLMFLYRVCGYTFHITCAVLLLSITALAFTRHESGHLEMVTIGMLGVLTGFVPMTTVDAVLRSIYVMAGAYACYTSAITIWNVPFPLLIVGVILSVMIIYRIGASCEESGIIRRQVVLLGHYSLFGYIAQIAILQILRFGVFRADLSYAGLVISFCAAFLITIVSVDILDRARARAASLDRLYKVVFA